MSNKSRLQINNTNLQSLIDKANSLPDAGSGGSPIEMCTGVIETIRPSADDFMVFSLDQNLELTMTVVDGAGGTFSVAKGTIVAVTPWYDACDSLSGGVSELFQSSYGAAFYVTGDFTLAPRF